MTRVRAPRGQRVTLTINPNLASEVARSAIVAAKLEALVEQIAIDAQQHVPVGDAAELSYGREPGQLRDSEEHGVILTAHGLVGVLAYHAFYAAMVHNGTRYAPPNPWLLNAALGVLVSPHV